MGAREITEGYAEGFDAKRDALQIPRDLALLSLSGKTPESVNTYTLVENLSSGWFPEAKRGSDGRAYNSLKIADVYDELRALIDGTGNTPRTTHYAFGGIVHSLERDSILRPTGEPFVWDMRGYETQDRYE